jgi:hypothetical protein
MRCVLVSRISDNSSFSLSGDPPSYSPISFGPGCQTGCRFAYYGSPLHPFALVNIRFLDPHRPVGATQPGFPHLSSTPGDRQPRSAPREWRVALTHPPIPRIWLPHSGCRLMHPLGNGGSPWFRGSMVRSSRVASPFRRYPIIIHSQNGRPDVPITGFIWPRLVARRDAVSPIMGRPYTHLRWRISDSSIHIVP